MLKGGLFTGCPAFNYNRKMATAVKNSDAKPCQAYWGYALPGIEIQLARLQDMAALPGRLAIDLVE